MILIDFINEVENLKEIRNKLIKRSYLFFSLVLSVFNLWLFLSTYNTFSLFLLIIMNFPSRYITISIILRYKL